jgi:alkylated DNA nucleotide flippase Atl1
MVIAREGGMGSARRSTRRAADARAARRTVSRAASGWEAKLRPDLEPVVVPDRRGRGTLLLPTPLLVGEMIAAIPCGHVSTVGQLRAALARRFGADATCPLMTGIFAAILAGAVSEDLGRDHPPRWPIWRLVRDDGTLHERWPLAARYRATRLREEGVRITRRSGHWAAFLTQHC